ncbi:MAG: glycosyltransferase [Acidimicrobiia bacterium]|nr:glycosyltransferase [Acidimicrobiia bacterium]
MTSGVPPADVNTNNWRSLDFGMPALRKFIPTMPTSVVITHSEASERLDLTLAALERQTYPPGLFEVVVVTDTDVPSAASAGSLQVRVVPHPSTCDGPACAHNAGARAASHPILVFLDSGMIPEADWLAAHARWHHEACDVLTLGFEARVDVGGIGAAAVRNRRGRLRTLFRDRPHTQPERIEFHMVRTNQLTSVADDLFRVASSNNVGIGSEFFGLVGGFDESFTERRIMNLQFGFRAYTLGGLFVPVRQAFCWRHDQMSETTGSEHLRSEIESRKASHLIAHAQFRRGRSGHSFAIPLYVVTVDPGMREPDAILSTVQKLLDNSVRDMVVWVGDRPDDPGCGRLRQLLEPHPRVFFGPLDEASDGFPSASFHLRVPAGARCDPDMVLELRRQLGTAAVGIGWLADEAPVWIARAWAVHRSRRLGCEMDKVGLVLNLDTTTVDPATGRRILDGAHPVGAPSIVAKALREVRAVRSPRQARRFGRWALRAIRAQLVEKARYRLIKARQGERWRRDEPAGDGCRREMLTDREVSHGHLASYGLGAEILAIGEQASAVLAASGRVHRTQHADDSEAAQAGTVRIHRRRAPVRIDVVLADTLPEAVDVESVVVVLSESPLMLTTPAFDPKQVNPRGWVRDVNGIVGALGPVHLLPAGVATKTVAAGEDRASLSNIHHLEDLAGFHADPVHRAADLAALAGAGVPVYINDRDAELRAYLGGELLAAMCDERIRGADAHMREALSVRMRRAALRDHSLRSRAQQILECASVDGSPLPEVSILLSTKRPELLANALEMVTRQTYPRLQLVLALHGDGFPAVVDLAGAGHAVEMVRVPADAPMGSALNAAVAVSGGLLLTRFDDDGIYGPEHIWDLVLAREHSGAEIVGKGAEFVYLSGPDRTIHRFVGEGEAFSAGDRLAGGTLMVSRHDLYEAGGWRRLPRAVGLALTEDIRRDGGSVYRTHGFGYMMVRHARDQAAKPPDAHFLRQAEEIRYGRDLDFAGVGETS